MARDTLFTPPLTDDQCEYLFGDELITDGHFIEYAIYDDVKDWTREHGRAQPSRCMHAVSFGAATGFAHVNFHGDYATFNDPERRVKFRVPLDEVTADSIKEHDYSKSAPSLTSGRLDVSQADVKAMRTKDDIKKGRKKDIAKKIKNSKAKVKVTTKGTTKAAKPGTPNRTRDYEAWLKEQSA
jgi:hypothetical protein